MPGTLFEHTREPGRGKTGEIGDFFQRKTPLDVFIKKVRYYVHYIVAMRCFIVRIAVLLDKTQRGEVVLECRHCITDILNGK